MELPGPLTLLYMMRALPRQAGLAAPLPLANRLMAGMFVAHYAYRALLAPLLLNPSMSPIHPLVWVSAVAFQLANAVSLGGWLGGYGPTTAAEWGARSTAMRLGLVLWVFGLLGNMYHDDELREIRRAALRAQRRRELEEAEKEQQQEQEQAQEKGEKGEKGEKKKQQQQQKGVDKVYMLPENGLFRFILYPHYVCEWIEWAGFWMVGGRACGPARSFLLNEMASMVPRALQGKRWYVKRFGREKVGRRTALIPGVI
jgi:3-oxo-5-alpha-steroid 4-dehydrogenase 1